MDELYAARMAGRGTQADIIRNDMKKMFSGASHRVLDVMDLDGKIHKLDMVILDKDYSLKKAVGDTNRKFFVLKPEQIIKPGWTVLDLYGEEWLVMNASNIVDITYKGVLYRKNVEVLVKQPNNKYLPFMCCVYGTDSRQGQEEFHRITLPSASMELNLPLMSGTSHIKRDDYVIFDDTWWLVLRNDKYSEPNILKIYIEEGLKPRDVVVEMDTSGGVIQPEIPVVEPTIVGNNEIKIGDINTYTLSNYTTSFTWQITRNASLVNILENSNQLRLSVPYRAGIVGAKFVVQATAADDTPITSLTITIRGM